MSSLADELAADLDFSDEQSVHSEDERHNEQNQEQDAMDTNEDGEPTKETDRSANDASPSTGHPDNVHKVTKFLQSKQTKDILEASTTATVTTLVLVQANGSCLFVQRIEHFKSRDRPGAAPTEEDEEYQLIVNANSMTADIDGEIQAVHKVSVYTRNTTR